MKKDLPFAGYLSIILAVLIGAVGCYLGGGVSHRRERTVITSVSLVTVAFKPIFGVVSMPRLSMPPEPIKPAQGRR